MARLDFSHLSRERIRIVPPPAPVGPLRRPRRATSPSSAAHRRRRRDAAARSSRQMAKVEARDATRNLVASLAIMIGSPGRLLPTGPAIGACWPAPAGHSVRASSGSNRICSKNRQSEGPQERALRPRSEAVAKREIHPFSRAIRPDRPRTGGRLPRRRSAAQSPDRGGQRQEPQGEPIYDPRWAGASYATASSRGRPAGAGQGSQS